MEKIQNNVLDYILKDVNLTLERLGVSEKVEVVTEKIISDLRWYFIESKPIKVTPMIYKKTIIKGVIMDIEAQEGVGICPKGARIIKVNIDYDFSYFNGGHNGVEIGVIYYSAEKNIAQDEKEQLPYMIRKVRSLEI